MKTLIVEDIADDRRILRYNLERHGCDVIEASDGREGLELAGIHKPDLIISDALMPRMDGFQLLRSVKTDENLRSIPFIFYSAVYTGNKEVELAFSLGADTYIVKPKEPEEFWNEIQAVLEKCKLKREPAAITELIEEEAEYLRKYGNIVATKLEEKLLELERAVAERRLSEEALIESKERMSAISESSMDAIIMTDENDIISYFNPSAEKMFGYRQDEAVGKPLHDLIVSGEAREKYHQAVPEFQKTGKCSVLGKPMEIQVMRKDRTRFAAEIFIVSMQLRGKWHASGTIRDITERKRAEETIKYQAYHDLLTGLSNKALFLDLLKHEILQMQRVGKKLAVLFLDVDQFKNVNDSLGHAAGDKLIQEVAFRLRSCIREFDTVARIGGDEFTILLPLITRPEDAITIADKVMEIFARPFIIEDHELHMTASIGICLYPEDGKSAESLIKNADIALHYAKAQGRNNFQFYNSAINIRTLERILLENRLRQAVERGELVVYYQPQMDIRTRRIIGAEALVRWNHPELGLLQPMQFIPLAEEIGSIIQLDQWVMRTACQQLKAWEAAGHAPQYITINLSARQFQQLGLPEIISAVLKEANLRPECLGIEITETLAMQDTELTSRNVNRLNAMGVRLFIDDFGTGYSSLSYLKKLPIHKLKIDKSFISDLSEDRDYQAIINAIIAMAHILKLKVVAEGVETEEQMSFLNSRDCDEMQGYLFSKPVPAGEFEKMLV